MTVPQTMDVFKERDDVNEPPEFIGVVSLDTGDTIYIPFTSKDQFLKAAQAIETASTDFIRIHSAEPLPTLIRVWKIVALTALTLDEYMAEIKGTADLL